MNRNLRPAFLAALCLLSLAPAVWAQEAPRREQQPERRQQTSETTRLPPASVTRHTITLPGRTITLTATAGSLTLIDTNGTPQVEIGYIAYTKDDTDPATRPVTFAVNGGPGASSAYLNLLAIGPWRLSLDEQSISPSAAPGPVPNAETWLDFTDLVFIDPPGTGYSRVIGGDQVRDHFYSLHGDIDGLAAAVTRWLKEKNRLLSPKFFVGESYGGFRGPLLAEKLQSDQGIGFSGLILVSPVLDFAWLDGRASAPWTDASRLPSMAAAALARKGPVSREALQDVERYASGEYLVDLMRGVQDREAVERISGRVAAFTGLDLDFVRRLAGRLDMRGVQRETLRRKGEVLSAYDADVSGADPNPTAYVSRFEDPVLTAMTAPLTSAMVDHLTTTLNWKPESRYNLLNNAVTRAWKWDGGRSAPENIGELRQALALDGKMRVLVVHGFTDLVTPYYASQLLLNQIPDLGPEKRLTLKVYEGGHMFYSRQASRQAFRADAQRLFEDALRAQANGSKKD
ncbi:S10 family peptidase [Microvirga terricola]|uniref:Peptidase S10 n=1 Tax=Microvirga terricola TaxID=2719797 RepID=A0ABX0VB68_9HYPH|nr:peptidase S10 [Microvirga terricola]NIX77084.1 peptidase S10 [Microvirga terricola]